MHEERPFNDVLDLVARSPALAAFGPVHDRQTDEAALGRIAKLAQWVARCQHRDPPSIATTSIAVFAGSHGLATRGVSLVPENATQERIERLRSGNSPTNRIASEAGATLRVFDLAVDAPTPDISTAAALSEKDCAATIAFGMEALEGQPDCLAIGALGVGGGTVAAAVAYGLFGGDASYWVNAGADLPRHIQDLRVSTINEAVRFHRGHLDTPLEILRRLGGREMAAVAGAILAARHQKVPVVLDGYATAVAAAVLHQISPGSIDHVVAGHVTRRPAHAAILERLSLEPVLDLQMHLGEGAGATLAVSLLKSACAVRTGMMESTSTTS